MTISTAVETPSTPIGGATGLQEATQPEFPKQITIEEVDNGFLLFEGHLGIRRSAKFVANNVEEVTNKIKDFFAPEDK